MSYWSILSSVDYMDANSNVTVALDQDAALDAAAAAVEAPGRVEVSRVDGELTVSTVKHTPAWAVLTIFVFFIRKTLTATITARQSDGGTVLEARGKLDTTAASRLRALGKAA